MKLTIKLKNPKYCDGCRLLDTIICCKIGYEMKINSDKNNYAYTRPQQCIKENGE